MFSFHDVILVVLFSTGFLLGFREVHSDIKLFIRWFRSRRKEEL